MTQPDDGDTTKVKIEDYLCSGTVHVPPRCVRCNAEMIPGGIYAQASPNAYQHCGMCYDILFNQPKYLHELNVERVLHGYRKL